jgi:hypothetical protein
MLGVEALDLVQLHLGVLGPVHGFACDPPLGAGQACRQICASAGIMSLLWHTRPRDYFTVSWLPQPDRSRFIAQNNGVIPTPQHYIGTAWHLSDRYQMTR